MPTQTIGRRVLKLQQRLLDIRLGSGALLLPKTIKSIHLRFAPDWNGGHLGPRRFWRNELVRLKYHNPAVMMSVDNKAPQDEKAIMSIHFVPEGSRQTSDSETSSPAPRNSTTSSSSPTIVASTVRVETIDMTNITNAEILDAFVKVTEAQVVEPTAEDRAEIEQLKSEQARSAKDSKASLDVQAKLRREQDLLNQARGLLA